MTGVTQNQAEQAEKQIKAEFERLHEVLATEEALRLHSLASEEEKKITTIKDLSAKTKSDIGVLNELIDTLKKEMGNEDLPLVQVTGEKSSPVWCFAENGKKAVN